jgi:hypothetical protein
MRMSSIRVFVVATWLVVALCPCLTWSDDGNEQAEPGLKDKLWSALQGEEGTDIELSICRSPKLTEDNATNVPTQTPILTQAARFVCAFVEYNRAARHLAQDEDSEIDFRCQLKLVKDAELTLQSWDPFSEKTNFITWLENVYPEKTEWLKEAFRAEEDADLRMAAVGAINESKNLYLYVNKNKERFSQTVYEFCEDLDQKIADGGSGPPAVGEEVAATSKPPLPSEPSVAEDPPASGEGFADYGQGPVVSSPKSGQIAEVSDVGDTPSTSHELSPQGLGIPGSSVVVMRYRDSPEDGAPFELVGVFRDELCQSDAACDEKWPILKECRSVSRSGQEPGLQFCAGEGDLEFTESINEMATRKYNPDQNQYCWTPDEDKLDYPWYGHLLDLAGNSLLGQSEQDVIVVFLDGD